MNNTEKLAAAMSTDEHLGRLYDEEISARKRQKLINSLASGLMGGIYGGIGGGMLSNTDDSEKERVLKMLGGGLLGAGAGAGLNRVLMNLLGYRTRPLVQGRKNLKENE